jgi:hypothetical protein
VAADLKACHIVLVNRISRGINLAGGGVIGERRRDKHRGTKDQEAQVYCLGKFGNTHFGIFPEVGY